MDREYTMLVAITILLAVLCLQPPSAEGLEYKPYKLRQVYCSLEWAVLLFAVGVFCEDILLVVS